jgi:uncharacterized 2Fe-2S/4Fe-4S cluster protein (DUF4445 family)
LIAEYARCAGLEISSECGGRGICGRCKVLISDPDACEPPTQSEEALLEREEIKGGFRLACQARVLKDVKVLIPIESRGGGLRAQAYGLEGGFPFVPSVRKLFLAIHEPSVKKRDMLVEGLLKKAVEKSLGVLEYGPWALEHLPESLEYSEKGLTLTLWGERIIAVEPGNTSGRLYGAAIDVGTSKVVGHLVDLTDGRTLAVAAIDNPQGILGEDVMSRITFAMKSPSNLAELHRLSLAAVNQVLQLLCSEADVDANEVFEAVVVGNTVMNHLFLGLEVRSLAYAPFSPVVKNPINKTAEELGTNIHPAGNVHLPPLIAGFVGSDAVADLLSTQIYRSSEPSILVDIGTNTEVFAGDGSGLVACSCASGPAFEGAHIRHGMKAVTGAVERISIDPKTSEVEYETIGGGKPIGLCGSAMIDAIAEMWKSGLVDSLGRLRLDTGSRRLRKTSRGGEFVVEWSGATGTGRDITVSQDDIEEILLAKAAIHSACSIMLKRRNLDAGEVSKVCVAGAFGENVDPENAVVIGMLPDLQPDRFVFVGNTAVTGAKAMLVSREARETSEGLPDLVRYHELSLDPDFNTEFLSSIFIPHRELERFPTAKRLLR